MTRVIVSCITPVNTHDARVDESVVPGRTGSVVNDGEVRDVVEDGSDSTLVIRSSSPSSGRGSSGDIRVVNVRGPVLGSLGSLF